MDSAWLDLHSNDSKERSDAVADARAGQMFAEMLGMVCHREYFENGIEQMVCLEYHEAN